eukprot:gene18903-20805_t
MSDVEVLVENDACQFEEEQKSSVLINVTPYNGVDNIAFDKESSQAQNVALVEESNDNEHDFIMAIFVVVFDTKRGNEIEWKASGNINLDGVEFKALVSGSHNVTEDFVYFKHKDYFGLSCYGKKDVDSDEERHARMKSVGVVCRRYTSLHEHISFLERQVRIQLENPGMYGELLAYYKNYKNCPHKNNSIVNLVRENEIHAVDELPVLKITHPAGCFSQFIKYFGEKVFILWKLILLQKRILFFCPPPAGVASYRVYCTCLLGSHAIPFVSDWNTNPLFCVNVCDMASLSSESRYVACTTDKIFERKVDVYDAYVDCQNLKLKEGLLPIGNVNQMDRHRYQKLCAYNNQQLIAGNEVYDDEKLYTR